MKITTTISLVGLALFLSGCATSLHEAHFTDPRLGYLQQGVLNQAQKQAEYASQIAEQEFAVRKKEEPPSASRQLAGWQKYRQTLAAPISVPADIFSSVEEGKNVGGIRQLEEYIKKDPNVLQISGEMYSAGWRESLSRTTEKVNQLQSDLTNYEERANGAIISGNYSNAVKYLQFALEIIPESTGLKEKITSCQQKKHEKEIEEFILDFARNQLSPIVEFQKINYGQEQSSQSIIDQCQQKIETAQQLLDQKRTNLISSASTDQYLAACLHKFEGRLQDDQVQLDVLRLNSWKEIIRLAKKHNAFWTGYQATVKQLSFIRELPQTRRMMLHQGLGEAYAMMLPAAMEYYMANANTSYAYDRYGVAFALCQMVLEMAELNAEEQFPFVKESVTWTKRANETTQDVIKKLATHLARQLIVVDFSPQNTEGVEDLAYRLRTALNKKYEKPNDLVWGLTVPRLRHLSENSEKRQQDYFIYGEVRECSVTALPAEEISNAILPVGRTNITLAPNPLYGLVSGEPKMVYSQDVYCFHALRLQHRRIAEAKIELTYDFGEAKNAELFNLEASFPNDKIPLNNVQFADEAIVYEQPFIGERRLAKELNQLSPDQWPRSITSKISSDKEIKKAILEYSYGESLKKIDQLVARYPVDVLLKKALSCGKNGQQLEEADYLGQCILYCYKLTDGGLTPDENKDTSWAFHRKIIQDNIALWSQTRWAEQDEQIKGVLAKLWENSVSNTLLTLKQ